jgi:hypothetical protein
MTTNGNKEITPEHASARLRQMIIYIAQICCDEKNFGATMLNKILWFSDMKAYAVAGKSITGSPYVKLPYGPVPKGMQDITRDMIANHQIGEVHAGVKDFSQKRLVPLVDVDLSDFNVQEIDIVNRVAAELCRHSAIHVSEMSHGRAWKAAALYEEIPYMTVFVSDDDLTDADEWYTAVAAQKHGWSDAATMAK